MPPKVIVICGPTASGKTALGVALAKHLHTEVISADSMQIYRGMDIGTAKPTPEEMDGVPHHMMDVAEPTEAFSAARYVELADTHVQRLLAAGKVPLIVGGTGLYIDSILAGRQFAPFSGKAREMLTSRLAREGIEPLYRELKKIDPCRAAALPLSDEKRILRALEIWYETGKTMTRHDEESRALPPRYQPVTIFLNYKDRTALWKRINDRVDTMVDQGLLREVQNLLERGVSPSATAMQAIGYKELSSALAGKEPVEAAIARVKLRSRQYAKRQITWFRRYADALRWEWENIPDFSSCLQTSTKFIRDHGIG